MRFIVDANTCDYYRSRSLVSTPGRNFDYLMVLTEKANFNSIENPNGDIYVPIKLELLYKKLPHLLFEIFSKNLYYLEEPNDFLLQEYPGIDEIEEKVISKLHYFNFISEIMEGYTTLINIDSKLIMHRILCQLEQRFLNAATLTHQTSPIILSFYLRHLYKLYLNENNGDLLDPFVLWQATRTRKIVAIYPNRIVLTHGSEKYTKTKSKELLIEELKLWIPNFQEGDIKSLLKM